MTKNGFITTGVWTVACGAMLGLTPVETGLAAGVGAPVTQNSNGDDGSRATLSELMTTGPWIDVRAYPSINAAVTAIGNTKTTLVVPNTQTLTGDLIIPATLSLKILNGGSIVKTGTHTLNINGPFEAGLYQVFTGFSAGKTIFQSAGGVGRATGEAQLTAGEIRFGVGAVKEVYPEWWGVNGIDDQPALMKACSSIPSGVVQLTNKTYLTKSTLYVPSNITLRGVGMRQRMGSTIKGSHTGAAVVSLKGSVAVSLRDLNLEGDDAVTPQTGLTLGRGTAQSAGRHYIESIDVSGYFSKAAIYSIASEENTWIWINANVLGGGARYTFYTAEQDDLSVDHLVKSSNFVSQFFGIEFLNQSSTANSAAIYIHAGAGTATWLFKGGFTGMTSGPNSSHVVIYGSAPTFSGVSITFEDLGHEAWSNASPPVQVFLLDCAPGTTGPLKGLTIKNNQIGQYLGGTSYFINSTREVKLVGADIFNVATQHPSIFNEITDCRITLPEQDLIIANGSALLRNQINARTVITTQGASRNNLIMCPTYSTPVHVGTGPKAMTLDPSTLFTGTVARALVVEIDGSTIPNTFKWSKNGGLAWDAALVPITGGKPQLLTEGIYIKFSQETGLALKDRWTFAVKPNAVME